MLALDRDVLLGAAIQLIKDIKQVAFLGNASTLVKIEHMAGDFLKQLEPREVSAHGKD